MAEYHAEGQQEKDHAVLYQRVMYCGDDSTHYARQAYHRHSGHAALNLAEYLFVTKP